ncbi:MAG: hypothetical protein EXQ70_01145 [Solirubrobacterales bacterium]|nr:hypothetical protein [Solirubrobacterales bacterium]
MDPTPDDLSTPAWSCVHFVQSAPDPGALRERDLEVATMDASAVGSKHELMEALAASLRFPDWFGGNWDAVVDCLRDRDRLGGNGCVLIVHSAPALWGEPGAPPLGGELIEVWLGVAGEWAAREVPFHLVLRWS